MNYAYGGRGRWLLRRLAERDAEQREGSGVRAHLARQHGVSRCPGERFRLLGRPRDGGRRLEPRRSHGSEGLPHGAGVRQLAAAGPRLSCTKYNEGDVSQLSAESSVFSPAIARLNQRSFAFYVNGAGALRYAHSDSEWLCPTPSTTPCATWWFPHTHALPAKGGVDAVRIDGPQLRLLVVTVDGQGRLWESRLTTNVFQQETWTPPALIPGSSKVLGEPSLARRALCSVFLAYKTTGDSSVIASGLVVGVGGGSPAGVPHGRGRPDRAARLRLTPGSAGATCPPGRAPTPCWARSHTPVECSRSGSWTRRPAGGSRPSTCSPRGKGSKGVPRSPGCRGVRQTTPSAGCT